MPIFRIIRNGMHALLWKLVPQIFISTLATLLVTSIFPIVTNSAPPLALDDAPMPSIRGGPERADMGEPLADFLERVALSHVAALREPPAANQAAIVAVSEPTNAAAVPVPPPRPAAAPRHQEPISGKVHVVGSAFKVLPPQPPPPVIWPAAASASAAKSRCFRCNTG